MSEQNRTAPRWQDAREHTLKLLREERDSLTAELPRIESVDERELFDAWLARVNLALATIGAIDDAALARLAEPAPTDRTIAGRTSSGGTYHLVTGARRSAAEPAQPTAAERWRAVPERGRAYAIRGLETDRVSFSSPKMIERHPERADIAAALDAMLELAREAEGVGCDHRS